MGTMALLQCWGNSHGGAGGDQGEGQRGSAVGREPLRELGKTPGSGQEKGDISGVQGMLCPSAELAGSRCWCSHSASVTQGLCTLLGDTVVSTSSPFSGLS